MSSLHIIEITAEQNAASVKDIIYRDGIKESAHGIQNYVHGLVGGNYNGLVSLSVNAVKATGTFTLDTVIVTDAVSVNGVSFACVASGATGNQFNIGSDDDETAVNLAAAVNASATALVSDTVVASAAADVVTITAKHAGPTGNAITIASADATITASGARLTGGSNGDEKSLSFGLVE